MTIRSCLCCGPMLCSIILAVTLPTSEQRRVQEGSGELKVGSEGNSVCVCMDFFGIL